MSDFLHSFLTASQYIAPLMANFDTSAGVKNESEILYVKEGKELIYICVYYLSSTLEEESNSGR